MENYSGKSSWQGIVRVDVIGRRDGNYGVSCGVVPKTKAMSNISTAPSSASQRNTAVWGEKPMG